MIGALVMQALMLLVTGVSNAWKVLTGGKGD